MLQDFSEQKTSVISFRGGRSPQGGWEKRNQASAELAKLLNGRGERDANRHQPQDSSSELEPNWPDAGKAI